MIRIMQIIQLLMIIDDKWQSTIIFEKMGILFAIKFSSEDEEDIYYVH